MTSISLLVNSLENKKNLHGGEPDAYNRGRVVGCEFSMCSSKGLIRETFLSAAIRFNLPDFSVLIAGPL